ncbi:MAG: K(+)-transporting ATPase subunit F [Bacteroidales bacterium]
MMLQIAKPLLLNISAGYLIGLIIAVLLLAYLFYALIKPEKF